MNASEFFDEGNLDEAIQAQTKEVQGHPTDHSKRLFLFEMLAFRGDLERARLQIKAINYGDFGLDASVLSYQKLLDAETARRRLFAEGFIPKFLGEPSEHLKLRLEAANRLRENRFQEAAELLAKSASSTPAIKGILNGKTFDSLRDADDLFASVLEVLAHGDYFWLALDQIKTLNMNPPKFPRDLLWIPARLETKQHGGGSVFLPALYPGSYSHPDNQIKLGRMTDWKTSDSGPVLGIGQRTFLVGEDAISLLDWRNLEVN